MTYDDGYYMISKAQISDLRINRQPIPVPEKHPEILISFLNAILKPSMPIVGVEIKGTEMTKQFIDDKYSRLDVKATTSSNEIVNIEIQLKDEHNMIKQSLYYLSKMYEEQLGEGEDYSELKRTICINILNFKYLKTQDFHTGYRLKEINSHEELTDVIEMHFIEIPKLPAEADATDMLVAWTEFLKNPESEKVRSLELSVKEVREAKDELIRMSNNEEQRALYEMRAKILKDKVCALNKARREGSHEKAVRIAKNLMAAGMSKEQIAVMTELSIEEISQLVEKW